MQPYWDSTYKYIEPQASVAYTRGSQYGKSGWDAGSKYASQAYKVLLCLLTILLIWTVYALRALSLLLVMIGHMMVHFWQWACQSLGAYTMHRH